MTKHFKGFYTLLQELGSKATMSIFFHQSDLIVQNEDQQADFWNTFNSQLRGGNDEDLGAQVDFYHTSINDHSIIEQMSKIMSKMIDRQMNTLRKMMSDLSSVRCLDSVLPSGQGLFIRRFHQDVLLHRLRADRLRLVFSLCRHAGHLHGLFQHLRP